MEIKPQQYASEKAEIHDGDLVSRRNMGNNQRQQNPTNHAVANSIAEIGNEITDEKAFEKPEMLEEHEKRTI